MKKIVVNDINVFIVLLDVGLLGEFFCLPWQIYTTDFVMLELLREGLKDAVAVYETKGTLHVAKFEYEEFLEINDFYKKVKSKTNVSLTDCSVWYYAKQNSYTLLIGDRKLCNSVLNEGVEARGVIYVFDALVESGIIPTNMAYDRLALLKEHNPRLPQNEIEKRLALWGGEQKKKGGCQ